MMHNFNEIFVDDTKNVERISSKEYLENGKIAIIDQGKDLIVGYTDYENYKICKEERIIFGDHTRIFKYIKIPFITGADGTKVLKLIDTNKYNYKYFYYYLLHSYIPNTGYNRHFKWVKELKFNIPKIEKQIEIANKLDKVQEIIDLRKKQIEELAELIKAKFDEMFGNPVLNEKKWNTDMINNVAPTQNYKGTFENKVWILNLDMVESNSGRIIDYLYEDIDNIGNSTCTFNEENILYSKLRPYLNKVVIPNKKGFATSELVPLKPSKDKLNRYFLAYVLRSEQFVQYISEKVTGAKMPRVSMDMFRKFKLILPPLELQNKFADFVIQINRQKFMIEKSLKETEELQESLMNKYFN